MKKAIIFDLYDTLLKIEIKSKPYLYLLNHFVSDGEITPKELINHIMTSDEAAVRTIANLQDVGLVDENFDSTLFLKYLDNEIESTSVISGTFKTLDKLKGKYRLFVLSNLATSYKYPYYKFHLENWIEKAFFSCECKDKKPNASFFQKVLDFSGLQKEDFIMIGDNPINDVKASINFGIEARLKDKELEEIIKDLI
jgi:putative hydrolase of the HAD superfamily